MKFENIYLFNSRAKKLLDKHQVELKDRKNVVEIQKTFEEIVDLLKDKKFELNEDKELELEKYIEQQQEYVYKLEYASKFKIYNQFKDKYVADLKKISTFLSYDLFNFEEFKESQSLQEDLANIKEKALKLDKLVDEQFDIYAKARMISNNYDQYKYDISQKRDNTYISIEKISAYDKLKNKGKKTKEFRIPNTNTYLKYNPDEFMPDMFIETIDKNGRPDFSGSARSLFGNQKQKEGMFYKPKKQFVQYSPIQSASDYNNLNEFEKMSVKSQKEYIELPQELGILKNLNMLATEKQPEDQRKYVINELKKLQQQNFTFKQPHVGVYTLEEMQNVENQPVITPFGFKQHRVYQDRNFEVETKLKSVTIEYYNTKNKKISTQTFSTEDLSKLINILSRKTRQSKYKPEDKTIKILNMGNNTLYKNMVEAGQEIGQFDDDIKIIELVKSINQKQTGPEFTNIKIKNYQFEININSNTQFNIIPFSKYQTTIKDLYYKYNINKLYNKKITKETFFDILNELQTTKILNIKEQEFISKTVMQLIGTQDGIPDEIKSFDDILKYIQKQNFTSLNITYGQLYKLIKNHQNNLYNPNILKQVSNRTPSYLKRYNATKKQFIINTESLDRNINISDFLNKPIIQTKNIQTSQFVNAGAIYKKIGLLKGNNQFNGKNIISLDIETLEDKVVEIAFAIKTKDGKKHTVSFVNTDLDKQAKLKIQQSKKFGNYSELYDIINNVQEHGSFNSADGIKYYKLDDSKIQNILEQFGIDLNTQNIVTGYNIKEFDIGYIKAETPNSFVSKLLEKQEIFDLYNSGESKLYVNKKLSGYSQENVARQLGIKIAKTHLGQYDAQVQLDIFEQIGEQFVFVNKYIPKNSETIQTRFQPTGHPTQITGKNKHFPFYTYSDVQKQFNFNKRVRKGDRIYDVQNQNIQTYTYNKNYLDINDINFTNQNRLLVKKFEDFTDLLEKQSLKQQQFFKNANKNKYIKAETSKQTINEFTKVYRENENLQLIKSDLFTEANEIIEKKLDAFITETDVQKKKWIFTTYYVNSNKKAEKEIKEAEKYLVKRYYEQKVTLIETWWLPLERRNYKIENEFFVSKDIFENENMSDLDIIKSYDPSYFELFSTKVNIQNTKQNFTTFYAKDDIVESSNKLISKYYNQKKVLTKTNDQKSIKELEDIAEELDRYNIYINIDDIIKESTNTPINETINEQEEIEQLITKDLKFKQNINTSVQATQEQQDKFLQHSVETTLDILNKFESKNKKDITGLMYQLHSNISKLQQQKYLSLLYERNKMGDDGLLEVLTEQEKMDLYEQQFEYVKQLEYSTLKSRKISGKNLYELSTFLEVNEKIAKQTKYKKILKNTYSNIISNIDNDEIEINVYDHNQRKFITKKIKLTDEEKLLFKSDMNNFQTQLEVFKTINKYYGGYTDNSIYNLMLMDIIDYNPENINKITKIYDVFENINDISEQDFFKTIGEIFDLNKNNDILYYLQKTGKIKTKEDFLQQQIQYNNNFFESIYNKTELENFVSLEKEGLFNEITEKMYKEDFSLSTDDIISITRQIPKKIKEHIELKGIKKYIAILADFNLLNKAFASNNNITQQLDIFENVVKQINKIYYDMPEYFQRSVQYYINELIYDLYQNKLPQQKSTVQKQVRKKIKNIIQLSNLTPQYLKQASKITTKKLNRYFKDIENLKKASPILTYFQIGLEDIIQRDYSTEDFFSFVLSLKKDKHINNKELDQLIETLTSEHLNEFNLKSAGTNDTKLNLLFSSYEVGDIIEDKDGEKYEVFEKNEKGIRIRNIKDKRKQKTIGIKEGKKIKTFSGTIKDLIDADKKAYAKQVEHFANLSNNLINDVFDHFKTSEDKLVQLSLLRSMLSKSKGIEYYKELQSNQQKIDFIDKQLGGKYQGEITNIVLKYFKTNKYNGQEYDMQNITFDAQLNILNKMETYNKSFGQLLEFAEMKDVMSQHKMGYNLGKTLKAVEDLKTNELLNYIKIINNFKENGKEFEEQVNKFIDLDELMRQMKIDTSELGELSTAQKIKAIEDAFNSKIKKQLNTVIYKAKHYFNDIDNLNWEENVNLNQAILKELTDLDDDTALILQNQQSNSKKGFVQVQLEHAVVKKLASNIQTPEKINVKDIFSAVAKKQQKKVFTKKNALIAGAISAQLLIGIGTREKIKQQKKQQTMYPQIQQSQDLKMHQNELPYPDYGINLYSDDYYNQITEYITTHQAEYYNDHKILYNFIDNRSVAYAKD